MDIVCFLSLNISLSCQGTVGQKKAAPGLGDWLGRQHRAVNSKASRAGMVAVAGDSHGPAVILMPLFPRRWCRVAWRHHLRAWAASLLGAGGDCRACCGAQSPDTGNLFLLSFPTSLSSSFHNAVFSFFYV